MLNSYEEGWPRASHMPAVRSRHQCCAAQALQWWLGAKIRAVQQAVKHLCTEVPARRGLPMQETLQSRILAHAFTSPYLHSIHRRPQTLIANITVSNKEYDCSSDLLAIGLTSLPTSCCSARITHESKTPPTRQRPTSTPPDMKFRAILECRTLVAMDQGFPTAPSIGPV